MTKPRSSIVSLSDTPWYHVVSRCVRRAFLCGRDTVSGRNFNHRRGWIEKRILELAGVFTIDVAAYAVMSNHYHIVLHVDEERAHELDDGEVLRRWRMLFTGPEMVRKYLSEEREGMSSSELEVVRKQVQIYRERLCDLSWFMRVLNETIARMANAEDGCTGHFWEGRFKSQALLDEAAVLAAMSYVDLNPIRAAMSESIEESDHTSVKKRLQDLSGMSRKTPEDENLDTSMNRELELAPGGSDKEELHEENKLASLPEAPLLPFADTLSPDIGIPFSLEDYFELLDTYGRIVHPRKRGRIPEKVPRLLQQLGIDGKTFSEYANKLLKVFGTAIGSPERMREFAAAREVRCLRGVSFAKNMYKGMGRAA